jgi:cytochrome c5
MLFTAALIALALGFCFAVVQVYQAHAALDGTPGISAEDISIAYSDDAPSNRLQDALLGTMAPNAPSKDRRVIMAWAAAGADKTAYETTIKPIVDKRCMRCHAASQWGAPLFGTYESFAEFAKSGTGTTQATLTRVLQANLLAVTLIFVLLGLVFRHARVRPAWLKPVLMVLPFPMILADIGAWYLARQNTDYVWIILASGVAMGLIFAVQWGVSMVQNWVGTD